MNEYYITPYIEQLRSLPEEETGEKRRKLEKLLSVLIGDPDVLSDILGHSPEPFDDFYGERNEATPETGDAISIFLSNFGGPISATLPEEVPIVPAFNYAETILGTPEATPAEETAARTDQTSEPKKAPEPAPLTESLVRILVKKGEYKEALQIIHELNLKNPEKSIYFADQLRFLRKVLISKSKSSN